MSLSSRTITMYQHHGAVSLDCWRIASASCAGRLLVVGQRCPGAVPRLTQLVMYSRSDV